MRAQDLLRLSRGAAERKVVATVLQRVALKSRDYASAAKLRDIVTSCAKKAR